MQTPSENNFWTNQEDHLDTLPVLSQSFYGETGFEAASEGERGFVEYQLHNHNINYEDNQGECAALWDNACENQLGGNVGDSFAVSDSWQGLATPTNAWQTNSPWIGNGQDINITDDVVQNPVVANLADVDLADINFNDTNLTNVNFADGNLADVDLADINFNDINLTNVNFADGNLAVPIDLINVNFADGNLAVPIDPARHHCTSQGCNSSFGRKADLDRHITTKHRNVRYYPCTVASCPKSRGINTLKAWKGYSRMDKLQEHMRKKHAGTTGFSTNA